MRSHHFVDNGDRLFLVLWQAVWNTLSPVKFASRSLKRLEVTSLDFYRALTPYVKHASVRWYKETSWNVQNVDRNILPQEDGRVFRRINTFWWIYRWDQPQRLNSRMSKSTRNLFANHLFYRKLLRWKPYKVLRNWNLKVSNNCKYLNFFISSKEFIFVTGHDKAFLLAILRDTRTTSCHFHAIFGKNWPNNRLGPHHASALFEKFWIHKSFPSSWLF